MEELVLVQTKVPMRDILNEGGQVISQTEWYPNPSDKPKRNRDKVCKSRIAPLKDKVSAVVASIMMVPRAHL